MQIGGLSTKREQALIERPAVMACGKEHSAAISGRGQLFTWGLAASGELGRSECCGNATPGPAFRAPPSLVFVTAGGNHTLAISKVRWVKMQPLVCTNNGRWTHKGKGIEEGDLQVALNEGAVNGHVYINGMALFSSSTGC